MSRPKSVDSDRFNSRRNLLKSIDDGRRQLDFHASARAVHALITDLEDRSLLNDVVVLMGGEFGRTPRIGDQTPDGRGHWLDARFLWMAGGGTQTGQIIGRTDARGERVIGNPIRASNVYTSQYTITGIDPATTLLDHNGRPQYLVENRSPVPGLL